MKPSLSWRLAAATRVSRGSGRLRMSGPRDRGRVVGGRRRRDQPRPGAGRVVARPGLLVRSGQPALGSGDAAVGVDGLAVDPAAGAGEEGHDLGDVAGDAQAPERVQARHVLDGRLVLAIEEQRRGRRAGSYAFTVMSRPCSSFARTTLTASTAPLVAAYAV